MDQTALKFIDQRQAVLRDAYENYLERFDARHKDGSLAGIPPKSPLGGHNRALPGVYAWGQWSEQDLDDVIASCATGNKVKNMVRFHPRLGNTKFRRKLKIWVREFLEDKG
jgi:hypothetical protein